MGYEEFFRLKDAPFRLAPDPDYYFPSEIHKEALDTLHYSIQAGEGFVQITGEPGTGKTMLLRTLLRDVDGEVSISLVLNPNLSPNELVRVILEDAGVNLYDKRDKEDLLRAFAEILLDNGRKGKRMVIIIDEAQKMPNDTLEELRLLSNLETEKKKLLQIILVGQAELEDKLANPELRQLAQRITIRYRLEPLSRTEMAEYIYHRLKVAGGGEFVRFSPGGLKKAYKMSRGIPRLINIICERALMVAFMDGINIITERHLEKGKLSITGKPRGSSLLRQARVLAPWALVAILALIGIGTQQRVRDMLHSYRMKPVTEMTKPADQVANKESSPPAAPPIRVETVEPAPAQSRVATEKSNAPSATPARDDNPKPVSAEPQITEKEANLTAATPARNDTSEHVSAEPQVTEKGADLPASAESAGVESQPITGSVYTVPAKEEDAKPAPPTADTVVSSNPAPPSGVFHIARNKAVMTIDCEEKKIYLWQGGNGSPVLKGEYEENGMALTKGLYLLGDDPKRGRFIFNNLYSFRAGSKPDAETLWAYARNVTAERMIPLLVYSSKDPMDRDILKKAGDIGTTVGSWANAWRGGQVDRFFGHYGDVIRFYDLKNDKPVVTSREDFYNARKDSLAKAGAVSLTISDPVCVLDPVDRKLAMVMFSQRYGSLTHSDRGTKVLFLHLFDAPDRNKVWKITANFWMPTVNHPIRKQEQIPPSH